MRALDNPSIGRAGTWQRIIGSQQFGLTAVILLLSFILSTQAGSHTDHITGKVVNNFLSPDSISLVFTQASFFSVMAVGATLVIITGGIDLSVGSTYALSAVTTLMALQRWKLEGPTAVWVGLGVALAVGLVCGAINGIMVVKLKVHPFIITLGTMWIYRGIAFVTTQAESLVGPDSLTSVMKATFGLGGGIYPVPLLILVGVAVLGTIFLTKTVAGRYVFAVGGNLTASVYSGVNVGGVLVLVYAICGLMAGLSAFMGCGYYSGANCNDAQGYELYVIASAVVGGVSLVGGKGSALGATLGALLIILIRQSISFLHLDQNYQWIIIGAAIVAAVVLDRTSSALGLKRLASSKTTGGT